MGLGTLDTEYCTSWHRVSWFEAVGFELVCSWPATKRGGRIRVSRDTYEIPDETRMVRNLRCIYDQHSRYEDLNPLLR
jgi:hypothetical protein